MQFGIFLDGWNANDNLLCGNYVGVDVTGTLPLGNGFTGVLVYSGASSNTIGGLAETDGNLMSANGWSGLE